MEVRLRSLRESDLAEFYRWQEEDPDWEWFSCRPIHRVRPQSLFRERFLEASRRTQQELMVVDVDGRTAGRVVAFDWNPRNGCLEIGYYLAAAFRGQGVGRAAVGQWVDWLFTARTVCPHKLIATTAEGNRGSCRLLERLGFTLDGRVREHYMVAGSVSDQMIYTLLGRDWPGRIV